MHKYYLLIVLVLVLVVLEVLLVVMCCVGGVWCMYCVRVTSVVASKVVFTTFVGVGDVMWYKRCISW